MKRLCVFYDSPSRRTARDWRGKRVEWIVCKECQKRLAAGKKVYSSLSEPFSRYVE